MSKTKKAPPLPAIDQNTPHQSLKPTAERPEGYVLVQKRSRTGKIVAEDAEAIAQMVVRLKLNETEACLHYGITPKAWSCWKTRHANSEVFVGVVSRVRAMKVESLLGSIEHAGYRGERPDWRAHAWLLERTEPDRFGERRGGPEINIALVSDGEWSRVAAMAGYGQSAIVASEPPKQILEPQPVVVSSGQLQHKTEVIDV